MDFSKANRYDQKKFRERFVIFYNEILLRFQFHKNKVFKCIFLIGIISRRKSIWQIQIVSFLWQWNYSFIKIKTNNSISRKNLFYLYFLGKIAAKSDHLWLTKLLSLQKTKEFFPETELPPGYQLQLREFLLPQQIHQFHRICYKV